MNHANVQKEQTFLPGVDRWDGIPYNDFRRVWYAALIVALGSIAMDGVSLTVSAVSDPAATEPWFEVSLIPETLEATTFDSLQPGSPVNLETDILARHVQRLLAFPSAAEAAPTEGGSR